MTLRNVLHVRRNRFREFRCRSILDSIRHLFLKWNGHMDRTPQHNQTHKTENDSRYVVANPWGIHRQSSMNSTRYMLSGARPLQLTEVRDASSVFVTPIYNIFLIDRTGLITNTAVQSTRVHPGGSATTCSERRETAGRGRREASLVDVRVGGRVRGDTPPEPN